MNALIVIAADGPNGKHLPVTDELIWGTLAFLVLVGIFLWKGLGPLKEQLAASKEAANSEFTKAEAEVAEAERKRDELVSGLGNVDAERQKILAEADQQAVDVKAEMIARADADAAELRAKTSADLGSSQDQASADLQSEMSQLTIASAEALVESNLDETTQRDLVEAYINQVGSSN